MDLLMQNRSATGFFPSVHIQFAPLQLHFVAMTDAGPLRALVYVLSGHLARHIAFFVVDSHESKRGKISEEKIENLFLGLARVRATV